ncbi:MAG: hypothetical protein LBP28_05740 [Coriobacteriales bacterium]|nr:hypothetical protein [Coriobacteriales bacterium]
MYSMYGIELNSAQYEALKDLAEKIETGEDPRQYVIDKIAADDELLDVYLELHDKGLMQGVKGWGVYVCSGLTSNGRNFVADREATTTAEARKSRNQIIREAAFALGGAVLAVASTLTLHYVFGIG